MLSPDPAPTFIPSQELINQKYEACKIHERGVRNKVQGNFNLDNLEEIIPRPSRAYVDLSWKCFETNNVFYIQLRYVHDLA